MLICDGCRTGWHKQCLVPPLTRVPRRNWFCPACSVRGRQQKQMPLQKIPAGLTRPDAATGETAQLVSAGTCSNKNFKYLENLQFSRSVQWHAGIYNKIWNMLHNEPEATGIIWHELQRRADTGSSGHRNRGAYFLNSQDLWPSKQSVSDTLITPLAL
jgi:hypothetical protein